MAAPDHWHKHIVLDGLSAGKDVYIEKPMTYRIEDGPAIINEAREHKRIVQVGSLGLRVVEKVVRTPDNLEIAMVCSRTSSY